MSSRIFLISLILQGLTITGCSNMRVLLAGEDVLAQPGETVEVKARLQQRNLPIFKDIEKVPIHFRLIASPPGAEVTLEEQKITDDEGAASVFLPVPREGTYKIEVLYSGSRQFESKDDVITILAVGPKKPVAVFDLDYTLTKHNWINQPKTIEPYDQDTVRVVNEISKKYAVVYLSGRPQPVHRASRRWLEMNGFPDGPILLWYPSKFRWLETNRYKKDILQSLHDKGFNLVLGVGDRKADAKIYNQVGMRAIVLNRNGVNFKNGTISPDMVQVLNWLELGSIVLGTR